jgi:sec-independent protein translocase protein TatC
VADGTTTPEDDREAELESGRMPLLEHLIELRNRLMWAFGAIIVAFLVCYQFKESIYRFLAHPLAEIYAGEAGRKMIFTALTEAFFTYVKVSFWAALCLSFPIVAIQVWKFVAPGLYKNEREPSCPICARRRCCSAWARRSPICRDPVRVSLLSEL